MNIQPPDGSGKLPHALPKRPSREVPPVTPATAIRNTDKDTTSSETATSEKDEKGQTGPLSEEEVRKRIDDVLKNKDGGARQVIDVTA